jgi:TonB family protein
MKLAAWFVAILSAVGLAQELRTVPPILLTKSEAHYSEEAEIARLQGTVKLSVMIGEDGTPRDIRVVRPLGLGLDQNAVAAVSGWRFKPGLKDGQSVAVQTEVECTFAMPQRRDEWSLSRAQFTVPADASQPSILTASFPQRGGGPQYVTARVGFDISPQGTPVNIQIEDSSDPDWNDDVINLIREWRFLAALRNGTAIQSHATFDLTHGLEPAGKFVGPGLPVQVRPPKKK